MYFTRQNLFDKLTQVVIGGVNVDFIAKGKTEKLLVSVHISLSGRNLVCAKTFPCHYETIFKNSKNRSVNSLHFELLDQPFSLLFQDTGVRKRMK